MSQNFDEISLARIRLVEEENARLKDENQNLLVYKYQREIEGMKKQIEECKGTIAKQADTIVSLEGQLAVAKANQVNFVEQQPYSYFSAKK